MSAKNSDKNKDVIKELEKTISPILVVNNSTLKPYVELFEYEPENIYQQPLGCLVGFFEIREFSEDSAYIVNFLTSVLKKEYYINPKRPVTESLDSALHKVNMALSELAKHGNIEWLGKINAAICVIEKNNAHFSVSGNAKIFIFRNQNLSEISEGLASDSIDPHPLKTFVNVSSGRLEANDRMLITTADIFHILPAIEIKKNLQRFEGDKFIQFLKTALSNQMEMIVSIVIGMTEIVPLPTVKTSSKKKSNETANAFSEKTFANTLNSTKTLADIDLEESAISTKIETEPEYTDEKTGHIYIQGEEPTDADKTSNAQMTLYWDIVKEKVTQSSFAAKNEIRKRFSLYKKQLERKRELRKIENEKKQLIIEEEKKRLEEERVLQEIMDQQIIAKQEEERALLRAEREKENEQIRLAKEKIEPKELITKNKLVSQEKRKKNIQENNFNLSFQEKLRLATLEQKRNTIIDLSLKNKTPIEETVPIIIEEEIEEYNPDTNNANSNKEKIQLILTRAKNLFSILSQRILTIFKIARIKCLSKIKSLKKIDQKKKEGSSSEQGLDIIPHFSKIKNLFSRFSNKQKIYTLGGLILIFIVPIFIVHFTNKPEKPTITKLPTAEVVQTDPLANDKNIKLNTQSQEILSNNNIIATLIANGNPTIITKTSIIILQNNNPKEFPLPVGSGNSIKATYMKDLSIILVLTDSNKVLSFSPISTKFSNNNIDLSKISEVSFIGTYLTYLYVLDQKSSQINRFPRADGGFGEKTNWLKDAAPLINISDMTIDDSIYTISDNQVFKFFKGQKQPFSLEKSATPINFNKIYTTTDLSFFYALDTKNSRLVQFNKEGLLIAQFKNDTLKDGISLAVDEKNKIAYIATTQELISMSIQ